MKNIIPLTAVFASIIGIVWLVSSKPTMTVQARLPGADRSTETSTKSKPAFESATLINGEGRPSDVKGEWQRFRGSRLDNISDEQIRLARSWPEGGPPVKWRVDLGEGYAGAAIHAGKVYVLDYDQENRRDELRCLSLETGKDIWRFSYPIKVKRFHGMSRTVPAVSDGMVVTLGPKCHVAGVEADTGKFRWGIDLVRDYGTTVPEWYAGQCPLIDDGKVIIAPGGTNLLMAVDLQTGKVIWQTPNPDEWGMTHCSIVPMDFSGKKIYVYPSTRGVIGVDAQNGAPLFATKEWKYRIVVPSPVIVGGNRFFLTNGYNRGSAMFSLKDNNGGIFAKADWFIDAKTFGAEQQTPIYYKGHIFGIRGGQATGELVCLNTDGEEKWSSGSTNRFGLGPFMIAQDMIYILDNDGVLTLAEADVSGYRQLAKAKVLDGHEAWGPLALAGGFLLARDLKQMVCLDVREGVK